MIDHANIISIALNALISRKQYLL